MGLNHSILGKSRDGKRRAPLRSLRELADELGVTISEIQLAMARCAKDKKQVPQPAIKHTGTFVSGNTYYNPAEVKSWWKFVKETKA